MTSGTNLKKPMDWGTKNKMKGLINKGIVPGILAYDDKQPIGWCSVAPREDFPVLENSRVLKRIDDKPVWSVVCFYINKNYRKKGLSVELLNAAKNFAKLKKGTNVEVLDIENDYYKINAQGEGYEGFGTDLDNKKKGKCIV